MSAKRKKKLWAAIDVIEAQEVVQLVRAISYPHMSDKDRKAFDSKLKQDAYPNTIYDITQGKAGVDLKDSFLMKLKGSHGKR